MEMQDECLDQGTLTCPEDGATLHFKVFQGMRLRSEDMYSARCPDCENYYSVKAPKEVK